MRLVIPNNSFVSYCGAKLKQFIGFRLIAFCGRDRGPITPIYNTNLFTV